MPETTSPIGFTGTQTTAPDQAPGTSARSIRRPDLRVYAEYARQTQGDSPRASLNPSERSQKSPTEPRLRTRSINQIVDESLAALNQDDEESTATAQGLAELADELRGLFLQLSESPSESGGSSWESIAELLNDISSKVDRRASLQSELRMVQSSIEGSKQRLLEEIKSMSVLEQERLATIQARSKMVAELAERVVQKLR
ncbi:MAG: hypothetical protein O2881_01290 [Proteobacteria bacterium]|jgi:hypothetical protein|nr:hypothetical protein [Pseudomonadota bacterium]MDP4618433.1 hypothetical protein [Burkholderiaceae bacterium]HCO57113.1 hypothetical protein [Burkholderiales bacterium]MDP4678444.1 hypothetical protein [Burkholderiaceae bacterium]MDP4741264.1 hypothetical protein [Burkholderiaceae bacterium]